MRSKLLFTILATIMLVATTLQSAEIIPVWNNEIDGGSIQDMELLRGGNEFMLTTTGGEIQIRNTVNGELIKSHIDKTNLFMNGYFELTPDSNRVVMCNSGLIQLINLENFERLNYFAFGNDTIAKGFKNIVLDPIRPFAYVIITGWEKTSGKNDLRSKISVFNYETMKFIQDLTDYNNFEYSAIGVSNDGKYLATLNNGKAYLKVWDLEKMELIQNLQLWDEKLQNDDWWCDSKDLQFSELNNDIIFYSGLFPSSLNGVQAGIHKFIISSTSNSDDISSSGYSGKIIFYDSENSSLIYSSRFLYFNNYRNKTSDKFYKPLNIYPGGKTFYNEKENYFIGVESSYLCKFTYEKETKIENVYDEEIIISPNPTNNFINLNSKCLEPIIEYHINDMNGLLINQKSKINQVNENRVDFSQYPSGVYFLTINCNSTSKTFKIIKQN